MNYSLHLLKNKTQCHLLLLEIKNERKELSSELEELELDWLFASQNWEIDNARFLAKWKLLEKAEQEIASIPGLYNNKEDEQKLNRLYQRCAKEGRTVLAGWRMAGLKVLQKIRMIKTRLRENYWLARRVKMRRNELVRIRA